MCKCVWNWLSHLQQEWMMSDNKILVSLSKDSMTCITNQSKTKLMYRYINILTDCTDGYGNDCLTCDNKKCLTCDNDKVVVGEASDSGCVGK